MNHKLIYLLALAIMAITVYAQTTTATATPADTTTATPTTGASDTTTSAPGTTGAPGTTAAPSPGSVNNAIFGCSLSAGPVAGTASTSSATGMFIGFLDVNTRNMNYYIIHSVSGATGIALYAGSDGAVGSSYQTISTTTTNTLIQGQVSIPATQMSALFGNRNYIQITSSAFPNGDIRCTIATAPYSLQYVGLLSAQSSPSSNAPSTEYGLLLGSRNTTTGGFGVSVQFTNSANIGNIIVGAAAECGTSSKTVYTFNTQSSNYATFATTATSDDIKALDAGSYFAQITKSSANQEIRGQIFFTDTLVSKSAVQFTTQNCKTIPTTTKSGATALTGTIAIIAAFIISLLL